LELADLLSYYDEHPLIQALVEAAKDNQRTAIGCTTAGGSHTAILTAAAFVQTNVPQLLIAQSKEQAAYLQNDLREAFTESAVLFLSGILSQTL
jgi:excinuclease UvrABC helicase subunit UvrB